MPGGPRNMNFLFSWGGCAPPDPPACRGLRPRTPAYPGAAPPDPCILHPRTPLPQGRRKISEKIHFLAKNSTSENFNRKLNFSS